MYCYNNNNDGNINKSPPSMVVAVYETIRTNEIKKTVGGGDFAVAPLPNVTPK